jgi:hypothetical protein
VPGLETTRTFGCSFLFVGLRCLLFCCSTFVLERPSRLRRCTLCKGAGHPAYQCSESSEPRRIVCSLCGGGHRSRHCPEELCSQCHERHRRGRCVLGPCTHCGGQHASERCHSITCSHCGGQHASSHCTATICMHCSGIHRSDTCPTLRCSHCGGPHSSRRCPDSSCQKCGGQHRTDDCRWCSVCKAKHVHSTSCFKAAREDDSIVQFRFKSTNLRSQSPCHFCGCSRFVEETTLFTIPCCKGGTKVLSRLSPLPNEVALLLRSEICQRYERLINSSLALTACGSTRYAGPMWTNPKSGLSTLTVSGRLYHRFFNPFFEYRTPIGGVPVVNLSRLYMTNGSDFAKSVTLDIQSSAELEFTLEAMRRLQLAHSSVAKSFSLAVNHIATQNKSCSVVFQPTSRSTHGTILGDTPQDGHIAAVVFAEDVTAPSSRVVFSFPISENESDELRFIALHSDIYETLQYPLIFFNGDPGWNFHDKRHHFGTTSTSSPSTYLTLSEYVRQRILTDRERLQLTPRVTQEWLCDNAVR